MQLLNVRYIGPGGAKDVREADLYVSSPIEARREIARLGFSVLSVRVTKPASRLTVLRMFRRRDKVSLLRSLGRHTRKGGVSAAKAMTHVIQAERDSRRRRFYRPAYEMIRRGGGFVDALYSLSLFDDDVMAMMDAGEKSGTLRQVIPQAVDHIENKGKDRAKVIAAVSWLWVDIISAVVTVVQLQYQGLPWLERNAMRGDSNPASIQKFQHAIALAYLSNGILLWTSVLFSAFCAWLTISYFRHRTDPQALAVRIVRRIKPVQSVLVNAVLADCCTIFARLLRSGLPVIRAIEISSGAAVVPEVRQYWMDVQHQLRMGTGIARAMSTGNMLTYGEEKEMAHIQDNVDLAEVLEATAVERRWKAANGQRLLTTSGIMATFIFVIMVVLNALYIFWIQGTSIMSGLSSIGGVGSLGGGM